MKSFTRCTVRSTVGILACALAACGGGGGGGGGGAGSGTTYTIGGTIAGLSTAGLVLEDNMGNPLTVQPNATSFQFSTALANDSGYSVTVATNPTDETCSVSNGKGTVDAANVTTVSVSCSVTSGSNVVAITVVNQVSGVSNLSFNNPLVSVTVCVPSTTTCATINNILVDTGSNGLRLFKSQLPAALVCASNGAGLCPMADPANPTTNTIAECLPFADGYTWGPVSTAEVEIGSESAASVPIQIIDDSQPAPTAPGSCASGTDLDSITYFDAYGILGVGQFVQDCSSTSCPSTSNVYFSCSSGGGGDTQGCNPTTQAAANEVSNPVAFFTTDNNGVIVQLQAIADTGAATGSGSLIFGIGTETNNGLGSATVLTTNAKGYFTTSFNGQTLTEALLDSGSNALYFPAGAGSPLTVCTDAPDFYCPGSSTSLSDTSLSATNEGGNGTMSTVSFEVANLDYLAANDSSNYALDDVGGPGTGLTGLSNFFDWGLPFFYNRSIYVGIDGKTVSGTSDTGPFFAY